MDFYDAYKTFEELDEKTILSIAKINLPQIMRDSMHALAGYYEEFEQ